MPTRTDKQKLRNEIDELTAARAAGKLSRAGEERLGKLLPDDAGQKPEKPAGDAKPPDEPGTKAPETPPQPGARPAAETDEDCCCEKIIVMLEQVKIVELTTPRLLKDDVVVTAHSFGRVMAVSPQPFAYPLKDGKIDAAALDKGEDITPNAKIAEVESGRDCAFNLDCQVSFWEEDAEKLQDLVNETTQALIAQLSASTTKVGVPLPGIGLIAEILRLITQKLGLADDRMDIMSIVIAGAMRCGTPLADLGWQPALRINRNFTPDIIDDDTVRLTKTIRKHGGTWEVSLLVQRICNRD